MTAVFLCIACKKSAFLTKEDTHCIYPDLLALEALLKGHTLLQEE